MVIFDVVASKADSTKDNGFLMDGHRNTSSFSPRIVDKRAYTRGSSWNCAASEICRLTIFLQFQLSIPSKVEKLRW